MAPSTPSPFRGRARVGETTMPPTPNKTTRLHARELRKNMTDAERHLWQKLRGRQLAGIKFRRQHPIGPYIADFASLEIRLIIELDGGQHAQQQQYDQQRSAFLQNQGYRILRFWNHDVLQNTDGVLQEIIKHIQNPPYRKTQHPPSPKNDPLNPLPFQKNAP